MIDSTKIKYALLQYYGFKKGFYCCTEFQHYGGIADIFALSKKLDKCEAIDIEVKISKADFLNDFKHKVEKHNNFKLMIDNNKYLAMQPNKFYFCVPNYLTEFVQKYLKDNNLNYYGLIEFNESETTYLKNGIYETCIDEDNFLKVIKPAKKFADIKEQNDFTMLKDWMLNRLRNDCIGFYREKVYGKRYGRITKEK